MKNTVVNYSKYETEDIKYNFNNFGMHYFFYFDVYKLKTQN